MHDQPAPTLQASDTSRRSFIVRFIQGVHATMGATLAYILGTAVLAPSLTRREPTWLTAADLAGLTDGEPQAVTLRIARQDGATEAVDRRVVFLVRSGDAVKALDSTCTHLGCRTRVNLEAKQIECPCHGGVYNLQGQVIAGPPPQPLRELPARMDGSHVMVQV
ncbi:MAG TPA: ubiquinol-cytochrome c reductase iron-sulfur subunit [Vicinamibacterales bacterium]|jgi:Rieske Fe-S protein|nr:ubiquinol-cytochrome c reductase iron-sulfur subunit [Vicinamibacterales bacterium]